MAIITIPSAIGGVTIPGTLVNGPLGLLYSNFFGTNVLQYPRDLQSATKGHVVHFTVKKVDPVTYEGVKQYSPTFVNKLKDLVGLNASRAQTVAENVASETSGRTELINFQPTRKTKVADIFLYIPDTLNFQYNVTYVDKTILGAAAGFFGGIKTPNLSKNSKQTDEQKRSQAMKDMGTSTISSAVKNFGTLALQKAGYAVNPQLQLLFQGISFRTYQMAFVFTPYSRQEAETVKKIIQIFRENAAPEISTASGGMFFIPPASFTPEFLFNGQVNSNINKVAESVITNIDVNYSPNGWAAHDDGAPVQTTLTIQFQELELIDKNKIKQGF